jgi:sigma-B regulation protein RsbU (phosphoserine phosphatase)
MKQPAVAPRPTRLRPAGPLLHLVRRLRAPLWVKLAAGPLAITVLMLLIGLSIVFSFLRIQDLGQQMVQDSSLIQQATRLQITVRGMVNYSRDLISDPTAKQIASYFQQRKLVLEGLDSVRQPVYGLTAEEQDHLLAIERTVAETDRMVGLVQEAKFDSARSLWDRRVHDLSDDAVIAAAQFRQLRETEAGRSVIQVQEAILGSATTSGLLILLAVVTVLAFGWLNTGLVARPIRSVATAMQRVAEGDLDVTVDLAQRDELGLLEQSFNQMTRALRILLTSARRPSTRPLEGQREAPAADAGESALLRSARDAAVETSRMGSELQEAYHIQAALLPPPDQTLHGWHIEASTVPAAELGGDFYDLLNLPGGRVGLVIGDVSGHGAASALLAAWTQGMIAAVAANEPEPGRVLAQVNNALRRRLPRGRMVTLGYMVIDPAVGVLEYANAGHLYPLLLFRGPAPRAATTTDGADLAAALFGLEDAPDGSGPRLVELADTPAPARSGGEWVWLGAPGLPLGMVPAALYKTVRLPLAALQAFCLYSDGVIEARDGYDEMFGFHRLQEICRALPALAADHDGATGAEEMVRVAADFSAGHAVEDDMTVLLVRQSAAAPTSGGASRDGVEERYTWPPAEPPAVPAEPASVQAG